MGTAKLGSGLETRGVRWRMAPEIAGLMWWLELDTVRVWPATLSPGIRFSCLCWTAEPWGSALRHSPGAEPLGFSPG